MAAINGTASERIELGFDHFGEPRPLCSYFGISALSNLRRATVSRHRDLAQPTRSFNRIYPGVPGSSWTDLYDGVNLAILVALFHPTFPWIRFFNVAFLIASTVLMWRILR